MQAMRENARPDLLITGFGPFPRVKVNPSGRLAERLARDRRWARLGLQVKGETFGVGYASVATRLADIAAAPPRALLMFGVAARSREMRIEMRALNRVSRTAEDQAKRLASSGWLEAGAPASRRARAPVRPLLHALGAAGAPARLSRSAGTYVCNAAYWHALRLMPKATRVLFVHIPMPMRPGTRKRDSRPEFALIQAGARALALALAVGSRLSH
jgi:pyroglutamyl-peptidase